MKNLTKKQIAARLDQYSPLHSFSREKGPCSYKRYTKQQLLDICRLFKIDLS